MKQMLTYAKEVFNQSLPSPSSADGAGCEFIEIQAEINTDVNKIHNLNIFNFVNTTMYANTCHSFYYT